MIDALYRSTTFYSSHIGALKNNLASLLYFLCVICQCLST